jgi:hypothetical protein
MFRILAFLLESLDLQPKGIHDPLQLRDPFTQLDPRFVDCHATGIVC